MIVIMVTILVINIIIITIIPQCAQGEKEERDAQPKLLCSTSLRPNRNLREMTLICFEISIDTFNSLH